MRGKIYEAIGRMPFGQQLLKDRRFRTILFAVLNMGWNLLYGLFNGVLGVVLHSGWFLSMFAYYVVLGLTRLYAVSTARKAEARAVRQAMRFVGAGLILLAGILSLIVMLTISDAVGTSYNIAVMIAIAAFTFFIVTKAVVSAVQASRRRDELAIMLRSVSCASAVGSILSLERSMLSTFGSSTDRFTFVMEGASGLVGFLIVTILGVSMLLRSKGRREK